MANDTEKAILNTARKHFIQNGYAGARMQDIADDAGINKAMLHYYYRSKEKLYQEILGETLDQVVPIFAGALAHTGTFWEKLEKLVETYMEVLLAQPEIPSFMMSELSQKRERFVEELKKRGTFFPAVQSFLMVAMEEMEAGRIREIAPVHLFLNILGMTVFPFVAKPVFTTIMNVSESDFEVLMLQRKEVILNFLRAALKPD